MGARTFYGQWLKRTVWGAPSAADGYAGLVGTVAGIAVHYQPWLQPMVEAHLWQLPIWAFGAILVFRFFHAPYEIWKEGQAQILALGASTAIPKHALALSAEAESDFPDGGKVVGRLEITNKTSMALYVQKAMVKIKIDDGPEMDKPGNGFIIHAHEGRAYNYDFGDGPVTKRDGAIILAVLLTYGLPDEPPSREINQTLVLQYHYRGAITTSQCMSHNLQERDL